MTFFAKRDHKYTFMMPLIFSKDRLSPQTDDTLNEQHSGHITGAVDLRVLLDDTQCCQQLILPPPQEKNPLLN